MYQDGHHSLTASCGPTGRTQENRQVLAPATLTYSQVAQSSPKHPQVAPYSPHIAQAPSPASTESLLGFNMEEYAMSLAGPSLPHVQVIPPPGYSVQDITSLQEDLLERGLANSAAQITNNIKSHFANLGSRMEAMENKMDSIVTRTNQNAAHIQTLKEQALSRINDLENRSRKFNFRICGRPESITDIPLTVWDIISELMPNALPHRLELDRAHRALGPPRKDGSPRDIIVKPHFYATVVQAQSLNYSTRGTGCRFSLICLSPPSKKGDPSNHCLRSLINRTFSISGPSHSR